MSRVSVRITGLFCAVATTVVGVVAPASAASPPHALVLPTPYYVQIVAHQDDDLLFMNPDVQNTINAGYPITTVYLTAGETNYATNTDPQSPDLPPESACDTDPIDREDYAACRGEGARSAWAHMAGVADNWSRSAVTYTNSTGWSRTVEQDTLIPMLSVHLIFVNLPDWNDCNADIAPDVTTHPNPISGDQVDCIQTGDPRNGSLWHLWYDGETRLTITPSGSPVTVQQSYTHDDLLNLVQAVTQGATVIRTQDEIPDSRYEQNTAWLNDHSDHVVAARVTQQVAASMPDTQLVTYRNYNIQDSQVNLDAGTRAAKGVTFDGYYAPWDKEVDPTSPGYTNWPQREYHRFWGGTNWVGTNADGRLQAFAVEGADLLTWWQNTSGGWSGPQDLGNPGGQLAAGVSVGTNADGRLEVFALRMDTFAVVTVSQTAINAGFGGWDTLGNPNATSGDPTQIGQPVVASNADGTMQVFVKNGGGGVSVTKQSSPNNGFGGWTDLGGGGGIQDGLAAIDDSNNRIELFAYNITNGIGSISHWYQATQNGPFQVDSSFATIEPASPPTAALNQDGRIDVFYRLATDTAGDNGSKVGHTWQTAPGGGWTSTAQNLNGDGGIGPIGANSASTSISDGRIMLFEHNAGGGVSMTRQVGVNDGYSDPWTDTGGFFSNEPAVATNSSGEVVALAVDGSGQLDADAQTAPGGSSGFTGWQVVAA